MDNAELIFAMLSKRIVSQSPHSTFRFMATALSAFGLAGQLFCASVQAQTFPEALALAYQNNPDLNAARAALRGTDEQVPQALANWRPTISAVGSANYEGVYSHPSAAGAVATPGSTTGAGSTPNVASEIPGGHQILQPYSYGLQITQPVYRGGRTVADTSRAENTVKAGRAQLANTEETVLLNAGTSYLDVVRDQATIDLEVSNDQLLAKIADAFGKRLEVGEVTRTDVAQAEAQRGQSLSTRTLAESQLANSRAAFLRYVGVMPMGLKDPELPYALPDSLDDALALAEANNPQVLTASYTEAAARDSIDLAHGAGNPEVDLIGQAGRQRQGYTGSAPVDDAMIEAQLNIPLYTGGLVSSQVRQAKQVASQRLIEIESARRQAHQQAQQAWESLEATTAAIKIQEQAVKSARVAYQGSKEEDLVGTKTTLDVLSATQVLLSTQLGLLQTQHDRLVAKLTLLSALGQLTAEGLSLPVDFKYDAKDNYEHVHDKVFGEAIHIAPGAPKQDDDDR